MLLEKDWLISPEIAVFSTVLSALLLRQTQIATLRAAIRAKKEVASRDHKRGYLNYLPSTILVICQGMTLVDKFPKVPFLPLACPPTELELVLS